MSGSRKLFWNKIHVVGPATPKVRRPYTYQAETVEQRVWRLAERRCCRSATWILWTRPAFSSQLHICQVSCLHLLYCNASVLTTSFFLLAQRNTQAKTPAKIFTITYMVVTLQDNWLIDWLMSPEPFWRVCVGVVSCWRNWCINVGWCQKLNILFEFVLVMYKK